MVVVLVIAVLAIAGVLWLLLTQRRSQRLRAKFGPEYDRLVSKQGGRKQAEEELERRSKRVESLSIRPLSREERDRFAEEWRRDQAMFVDDPAEAVDRADALVQEVMVTRGYPVADFEQRAADVSVHHPGVVDHYRVAHGIAVRHRRHEASTEDLRAAMVHYRALFEHLLDQRVMERPQEVNR
jgi:hypothetical protein